MDRSDEFELVQLRAGTSVIDIISEHRESEQHLHLHKVSFGEFANRYGAQDWGRSVYIKDPDGNEVELKLSSE